MIERVFLIVLDSFGVGHAPDAADFSDEGSDTLGAIAGHPNFHTPTLASLGMFNIPETPCEPVPAPLGAFGRLQERSRGKDTTIGHWEIAGVVSPQPLPTYPNGFPPEVIEEFERLTGRKVICNLPYSGTDVIRDYGEEHMRTGALIVYTSADSVFQIAANEAIVPVEELYRYCEIARKMLTGPHAVGRVIARPFVGTCAADFKRTSNRHDYSLTPPRATMLDALQTAGLDTIGVGKIYDIFAGQGISQTHRTKSNHHGMEVTLELAKTDFKGLAFVNLVDFDMVYGHRNDVPGYAAAATEFDGQLAQLLPMLGEKDLLLITADHGCDPATPSTDHSREMVPLLAYGAQVKPGVALGTVQGFGCIAATVCEALGVQADVEGESLWSAITGR